MDGCNGAQALIESFEGLTRAVEKFVNATAEEVWLNQDLKGRV